MDKVIAVYGAGPTTSGYVQPLSTTISAYTSATTVTLAASSSNAVTNSERVVWGHDDTTATNNAVNAAAAAGGGEVYFPVGLTLTQGVYLPCAYVPGPYGNCTLAYNNIALVGEGQLVSQIENWNISPSSSRSLVQVGDSFHATYANKIQGFYMANLGIRQIKNPTTVIQAFTLYNTFQGVVDNVRVIGYSHECAIDGGGYTAYGDVLRNSDIGPCGNGGPAYSNSSSGINYNGAHPLIYNNYVWGSGQGEEYGGRGAEIYGNTYDGRTLSGGNQGICFNIGSTGSGVWNVDFHDNTCIGFLSAGGGYNSIGTMDRITIDHNQFINSGIFHIAGGLDSNSITCSSPLASCENDTVIHGTSTFTRNLIVSNTIPGGVSLDNGGTLSASLESFEIAGNTYQVNYNWGTGNPHIDLAGSVRIWKPSTAYTNASSNGYAYPTVLNGYVYQASTAGTTGTTEPTWPSTIGGTVTDGTVTWTCAYLQPSFLINNETFTLPAGYTESAGNGYDITFDNPSREMASMSNVSGNYAWQIYHRTANGRGNIASNANELVPANTPYSDSNRYFNTLPSSTYYAPYQRAATYFPLGSRQRYQTPISGNVGQVVSAAGWNAPVWLASYSYAAYSYVQVPTDNGHFYRNLAACTSNSTAPTFPTISGAKVTDNTCTWQESGPDAVFAALANSAITGTVGNIAISPGGSATVQFTSEALYGFASPLTLTASGAPAGVSLKFSTSTISAGQGAGLTISTTTKTGTAVKTITVTATGGGQSKTVAIPLTVMATVKT